MAGVFLLVNAHSDRELDRCVLGRRRKMEAETREDFEIMLIADIDSPGGGDINVKPQNLQSPSESLRATESVRR